MWNLPAAGRPNHAEASLLNEGVLPGAGSGNFGFCKWAAAAALKGPAATDSEADIHGYPAVPRAFFRPGTGRSPR